MKKTGASNNRHNSKQDYQTPEDFRRAVVDRFGPIHCDLAATRENKFGVYHIAEDEDSLSADWWLYSGTLGRLLFLNPPFRDIAPWAEKCAIESARGARILFLTPASVDSNWWRDYVHGRAWVDFLSPRLCFDGKDPFPKPCSLSCFNVCGIGYGTWRWKNYEREQQRIIEYPRSID
jgi:DNA N-6-adenine-methyltransferase (Dam).